MNQHTTCSRRAALAALVAAAFVTAGCGTHSTASVAAPAVTATAASTAAPDPAATPTSSTVDPMAGMNHGAMAGMDHGAHGGGSDSMTPPIGDGTKPTENGVTLAASAPPTRTGEQTVVLTLRTTDGKPVNDAAIEQTKPMHLIVVRSDLTGYQHVHPHSMGNGEWMADVDFATAGSWRLIADVSPIVAGQDVQRVVLGIDVSVPGDAATDAALPDPGDTASVDGYEVTKHGVVGAGEEHQLTFEITKGGQPAGDITEYLGAGGHLVALAEGTIAYTHLHPVGGPASTLAFMTTLPAHGRYRLFLQFATGDVVHTAAFTVVG